ncbi:type II toxin-antitoxin system RelE/ParE family toxin [Salmonella enterica]|nr:type II toxin-antitoxin system RelE/ParE family toxin [Salmonella enterica]EMB2079781.1 type II toxin-antitoxin system RelE/ParE family toxin [Salmonella enterica]EMC4876313.1 type II toxin-antitoxin system RelE/ParE family toxin [Salmonella enterica]
MKLLHFIETSIFQRKIETLLSHDEYLNFQEHLRQNPESGATISATGGCRKVRWAIQGKGKSGGIRVIYYYLNQEGEIYLLLVYPKNEMENLSDEQKAQLRKVISMIEGK